MHALNADRVSFFLDEETDERKRSAALAIHGAWLDHTSSLRRSDPLEPKAPLDFQVLYQAAVEAFGDEAPEEIGKKQLIPGGRIVNRELAEQQLASVVDPDVSALALRFANRVIVLSGASASAQDLGYCVELFLRCVADKQVIANVMTGEISRHSDRLSDPDCW